MFLNNTADLFPTLVHIRLLSSGVALLFSIGIEIGFAASRNRLINKSQRQTSFKGTEWKIVFPSGTVHKVDITDRC